MYFFYTSFTTKLHLKILIMVQVYLTGYFIDSNSNKSEEYSGLKFNLFNNDFYNTYQLKKYLTSNNLKFHSLIYTKKIKVNNNKGYFHITDSSISYTNDLFEIDGNNNSINSTHVIDLILPAVEKLVKTGANGNFNIPDGKCYVNDILKDFYKSSTLLLLYDDWQTQLNTNNIPSTNFNDKLLQPKNGLLNTEIDDIRQIFQKMRNSFKNVVQEFENFKNLYPMLKNEIEEVNRVQNSSFGSPSLNNILKSGDRVLNEFCSELEYKINEKKNSLNTEDDLEYADEYIRNFARNIYKNIINEKPIDGGKAWAKANIDIGEFAPDKNTNGKESSTDGNIITFEYSQPMNNPREFHSGFGQISSGFGQTSDRFRQSRNGFGQSSNGFRQTSSEFGQASGDNSNFLKQQPEYLIQQEVITSETTPKSASDIADVL